ncbi:MFS transporter [Solibacillus silvestris]|uniref:MFS transporter n=1 Tax=Solibacillus silvestris TaxID=76853 RepID=UPI003F7DBF41
MGKTLNPSMERYVHSEEEQQKLYKRTLWVVILSQTFGGAGLAAGITVGALIARQLLGSESFSGLPTALFTLGSALSAFLVGRFSQRFGRRYGLSFGFITGGVGAIGVVTATAMENIVLLFLALFIYGAGTSTNLQARYAGTDLAKPKQRATAISMAMVATTFGAVAGPNLVTPTGHLAEAIGLPALTGPFLLAALAYLLAGFTFFFLLKPDPLLVAIAIAEKQNNQQISAGITANEQPTIDRLGMSVGAIVLVLTHVVMVAIMTMTPVHMEHAGSGLSLIGLVISMHVAAMYLPSLVTGILVDKIGRAWMVIASGITLSLAGFLAAYTPGDVIWSISLALILLGLGWNFGLISGTAMIIDATTIQNRAKVQGSVDVSVALGGSAGGLLSGIIVANSSYSYLSFAGAYLAILLIPLMIWVRYRRKVED